MSERRASITHAAQPRRQEEGAVNRPKTYPAAFARAVLILAAVVSVGYAVGVALRPVFGQ